MIINTEYVLRTYKLKNLIRYNHKTKIMNENVSEHSYFVSLFVLEICNYFKLDNNITLKCLIKAILHDAPEIEINDITYDIKNKSPELRNVLHNLENNFYDNYYPQYYNLLTGDDKDNFITDLVVKLADVYSVFQFSVNELEIGNRNMEMREIYLDSVKRINNLEGELKHAYQQYIKTH